MTIIIEDGTGIADANSYDTVANAQAYFTLKGTTITITEESMINATQYLDLQFDQVYSGTQLLQAQSLSYPRSQFTDKKGFIRVANTVHTEIKTATYEVAKMYIDGITLFDNTDAVNDNLQSLTNSVDGAVTQSKTWFAPNSTNKKINVGQYLTNILKTTSTTVRIV